MLTSTQDSVIKEDGVEIEGSRSFTRYTLDPGSLDASDNLVDKTR